METKHFLLNEKNQKIATLINLPGGILQRPHELPAVIIAHGLKGYKEESHHQDLAERLSQKGFVVARFDMRGFGESAGTIKTDYRFSNYLLDLDVVFSYLLNQLPIKCNRVGLCGTSMGGMVAIIGAAKHRETFALVSISAPDKATINDDLGARLSEWKRIGFLTLQGSLKGKIRLPYEFASDIQQYDMKEYIKKVHIPSLFICGEMDTTVPPKLTEAIFKAANEPKELFVVDTADHFYKRDTQQTALINNKVVEFFLQYL